MADDWGDDPTPVKKTASADDWKSDDDEPIYGYSKEAGGQDYNGGSGFGGRGRGGGRGGGDGGSRQPREARPGDWTCPNDSCGASVFSNKTQCFKCGEAKPEGLGGAEVEGRRPREPRPGDWTCPNDSCGATVFSNKSSCFKCGEAKPEGLGGGGGGERRPPREPRPGDWTCPSDGCGSTNFAGRTECYKCNIPKPDGIEEVPADPNAPPKERYVPADLLEGDAIFEERNQLYDGSGINFKDYDNIPVHVTDENGEIALAKYESFQDLGLRPYLVENLTKCRYSKPTPIQQAAIPVLLNGRDIMACAQTGSGKTAAFLLPMLHAFLSHQGDLTPAGATPATPEALILAPTRELAIQIGKEANAYAAGSVVKTRVLYGGAQIFGNKQALRNGCNICVATPGRLKQLVKEGHLSLEKVQYFILDEADRMLDMGFMDDVTQIVGYLPAKGERISGMFSATFPDAVQQVAKQFLENYVFISVGIVGGACKDVEQVFEQVEQKEKRGKLLDILKGTPDDNYKIVVFCGTKKGADFLATDLSNRKISSTSIHGDRLQSQRETALREFSSGHRKVLVATAVAARGLDIPKVSMVINYDMPKEIEEYVHRIGRTGRVGHQGKAISFFDAANDSQMAGPLVQILKGAKQNVPDWLESVGSCGGGYGGGANYGGVDNRGGYENGASTDAGAGGDEDWD